MQSAVAAEGLVHGVASAREFGWIEHEQVKTPAGAFKTVRYEAFLFNNVIYSRSGRVYIWLTDDARRLPVQIQVRLQVHIGTITLQLEKEGT